MRKTLHFVKNAFLAFTVAVMTVCLGFAIKTVVPSRASAASAPNIGTPAATYCLGASGQDNQNVYYFDDFSAGWTAAVRRSVESMTSNTLVKVVLYADWQASDPEAGFGADGIAFSNGRIHVPKGAHIWLDLGGYKIDRNLTQGVEEGNAISVAGTLEIDGSDGGKITGAYNTSSYGGALMVQNGTVNLRSGEISGNKVSGTNNAYGAGVFLSGGATLNVYNKGKISNNTVVGGNGIGGGVAIYNDATFTMNGGTITGNGYETGVVLNGGGIGIATSNSLSQPTVTLLDGSVTNNGAVNGGGIAVCGKASVILSGTNVAISGNTATASGGGLYVADKDAAVTLSGSRILQNTASVGGGVSVQNGKFDVTGGDVTRNVANSTGAALSVAGGSVKMTSGNISSHTSEANDNAVISITGGSTELAGGQITKNTSQNGAIISVNGKLTVSGIVTGNQSNVGAVVLEANADLTLAGNVLLAENGLFENASTQRNLVLTEGGNLPSFGTLGANAKVGITVKDGADFKVSTQTLSAAYGEFNAQAGTEQLYRNPMDVLVADIVGQKFVLNAAANVVGVKETVSFTVTYGDGTDETYIYGISKEEAGYRAYVGTSFVYGDKTVTSVVYRCGDNQSPSNCWDTSNTNAGSYGVNCGDYLFSVVIAPYAVSSNELTCTVENADNIVYNGKAQTPAVTVTLRRGGAAEITLAADDYTVDYGTNNVKAGNVTATVTLKRNYSGKATVGFTVRPSETTYEIEWQYYSETKDETNPMLTVKEWKTLEGDAFKKVFVYDPSTVNQNARIRAKLTAGTGDGQTIETVYMSSVLTGSLPIADTQRNANMRLVLTRSGSTSELGYFGEVLSAGIDYIFTVEGSGNYTLPESRSCNVVMNTLTVALSAEDFELETTEEQILLIDGSEEFFDSYVDPITGEDVTLENSVARYTGTPIVLEVNEEFSLSDGRQLKDLGLRYAISSLNITNAAAGTTGASGEVHEIVTTITVTPTDGVAFAGSTQSFVLTKEWRIVTMNNDIRYEDGREVTNSSFSGWNYCEGNSVTGFRPEHGDTIIYTYTQIGNVSPVRQFAVVFENDETNAAKKYYEVKTENGAIVADTMREITVEDYFATFNRTLAAGTYRLTVRVPASEALGGSHTHWWEGGRDQYSDLDTVYNEFERSFTFTVAPYSVSSGLEWNVGFNYEFITNRVEYNGQANNTPQLSVTLHGVQLVEGEDYILTSSQINVGTAELTIEGINSLTGRLKLEETYKIVKAHNVWSQVPNVIRWNYGSYDSAVNVFEAVPALLDDESDLVFGVASDEAGQEFVEGLEAFSLEYGFVPDAIAEKLQKLPAGIPYFLIVTVKGNDNYSALEPAIVEFRVFTATNSWEVTPGIASWTTGRYDAARNAVQGSARFGMAEIVVKDSKGNVVYSAVGETVTVDKLASAKAGSYTLTARVAGSNDYSALTDYTFNFNVFKQPGLAWWAIMLIVISALALAAAILLILWKRGVFRILTHKLLVSIRTQATVDATIAAVRANRAEAESRAAIAAAEAAERAKKRKEALEAARNGTAEEQAASAEEKPAEQTAASETEQPVEEKPAEQTAASETEQPAQEKPAQQAESETAEGNAPNAEAAVADAAAANEGNDASEE